MERKPKDWKVRSFRTPDKLWFAVLGECSKRNMEISDFIRQAIEKDLTNNLQSKEKE